MAPGGDRILVVDAAPTLSVWTPDGRLIDAIVPPVDLDLDFDGALAGDLVAVPTEIGDFFVWDIGRGEIVQVPTDEALMRVTAATRDGWIAATTTTRGGFRVGVWDLVALWTAQRATQAERVRVPSQKQSCPG